MISLMSYLQIFVSACLIITILLQQKGAGSSAIFGGSTGANYYSKRGFEKILFRATIVLAGLFIVISFINLVL